MWLRCAAPLAAREENPPELLPADDHRMAWRCSKARREACTEEEGPLGQGATVSRARSASRNPAVTVSI